jgi:PKD repeat protein
MSHRIAKALPLLISVLIAVSGCCLLGPVARFSVSCNTGEAPLLIGFDASNSIEGGSTIQTYEWDFDDGTTSSGITTSHTFSSPGSYTIKLIVTDSSGRTSMASRVITVTPSLIAHYQLEATVMNVALDESQYGNHGQIQDITGLVAGKKGNAYSFDGTDDWIQISDSDSLRSIEQITLSAWLKAASLPAAGISEATGIVAYGKDSQGMYELRLMGDGTVYFLLNWNTSSEINVFSTSAIEIARWHLVTCTFNGENASVYIDGELVGQEPCTQLVNPGEGTYMAIGVDFPGSDEYFHGCIDELRIYNGAISP